jgi:hypothetical protein
MYSKKKKLQQQKINKTSDEMIKQNIYDNNIVMDSNFHQKRGTYYIYG